jgi:hypothetical protein
MSLGADVVNVIIGVVGSLISLWLLFSIKPSLRLTWEVGRFYHFFIPCEVSKESLGSDEYYLLQVWSRHGFIATVFASGASRRAARARKQQAKNGPALSG